MIASDKDERRDGDGESQRLKGTPRNLKSFHAQIEDVERVVKALSEWEISI